MRVALVHYWLVNRRGGEKVLEALCRMYPQADVFTHVLDRDCLAPVLRDRTIRTSFIDSLPGAKKHYQKYLPLMPLALEQLDLRAYDLVVSSESGPAKGVITRADAAHVCYCHSPMRYIWDFYQDYVENAGWLTRAAMRPLFSRLRLWDVASAGRVDRVVANSRTVARRVARWWRREAAVVHPPVDVAQYGLSRERGEAYLCLGQHVGYKRTDLAVQACTRTGRRLVVAGEGEETARLRAMAGPSVSFVGRVNDAEAARLYGTSRALIFPGEEDFGMVPVEAQATGCPVVAYGRGGALETVRDGETGLFFAEQTVEALCEALDRFESGPGFAPDVLRAQAERFGEERFRAEMEHEIETALQGVRDIRVLP